MTKNRLMVTIHSKDVTEIRQRQTLVLPPEKFELELLGEPLASKMSKQQIDTLFVGGGSEKLQKKTNFWGKPALIQI